MGLAEQVIDQLGGGMFEGGGSMTKAIFPAQFPLPDGSTQWKQPDGQHIDGYAGTWSHNPQIGATLCVPLAYCTNSARLQIDTGRYFRLQTKSCADLSI
jgi:hypothetical protein